MSVVKDTVFLISGWAHTFATINIYWFTLESAFEPLDQQVTANVLQKKGTITLQKDLIQIR